MSDVKLAKHLDDEATAMVVELEKKLLNEAEPYLTSYMHSMLYGLALLSVGASLLGYSNKKMSSDVALREYNLNAVVNEVKKRYLHSYDNAESDDLVKKGSVCVVKGCKGCDSKSELLGKPNEHWDSDLNDGDGNENVPVPESALPKRDV